LLGIVPQEQGNHHQIGTQMDAESNGYYSEGVSNMTRNRERTSDMLEGCSDSVGNKRARQEGIADSRQERFSGSTSSKVMSLEQIRRLVASLPQNATVAFEAADNTNYDDEESIMADEVNDMDEIPHHHAAPIVGDEAPLIDYNNDWIVNAQPSTKMRDRFREYCARACKLWRSLSRAEKRGIRLMANLQTYRSSLDAYSGC